MNRRFLFIRRRVFTLTHILLFAATVQALCGENEDFDPKLGVPGAVIAYRNPLDKKFIGSPSIAKLEDGTLVASHDEFFSSGSALTDPVRNTYVYGSTDGGKTWKYRATIKHQFWSNLFVVGRNLYLIGTDYRFGAITIRKSSDGGMTWSQHHRDALNSVFPPGFHTAPVPIIENQGRFYRLFERVRPGALWPDFDLTVVSAAVHSDLSSPQNWQLGPPAKMPTLPAPMKRKNVGLLEGNIVGGPNGKMYALYRFNSGANDGLGCLFEVSAKGELIPGVNPWVKFPLGKSKFWIFWDQLTGQFWALGNRPGAEDPNMRNVLSLYRTQDLRDWELESDLIIHAGDWRFVAFQYPSAIVDGPDLLIVTRTALNSAESGHNANYMLFHRIPDFRKAAGSGRFPIALPTEPPRIGGLTPAKISFGRDCMIPLRFNFDPDTVTVSGLPKGLSYKASPHRILGKAVERGEFTIFVTAENVRGKAKPAGFTLSVK